MDVNCFLKTVISCSLQVITVLAAPYILFLSLFYLFIPLSFFSPQHGLALLFRVCSHFLKTLSTCGPALLSPAPVLVWQRRMSCVQPCQIMQPLSVHATSQFAVRSLCFCKPSSPAEQLISTTPGEPNFCSQLNTLEPKWFTCTTFLNIYSKIILNVQKI